MKVFAIGLMVLFGCSLVHAKARHLGTFLWECDTWVQDESQFNSTKLYVIKTPDNSLAFYSLEKDSKIIRITERDHDRKSQKITFKSKEFDLEIRLGDLSSNMKTYFPAEVKGKGKNQDSLGRLIGDFKCKDADGKMLPPQPNSKNQGKGSSPPTQGKE